MVHSSSIPISASDQSLNFAVLYSCQRSVQTHNSVVFSQCHLLSFLGQCLAMSLCCTV